MERTRWLVRTGAFGFGFGTADSLVNALSSPYQSLGSPIALGSAIAGTVWARVAEVAGLLLDAGWAWAALAVAAGWAAGTRGRGLIAGPLTLAAATIAYFCTDAALHAEPVSVIEIGFWGIASLLLGPVLGAIGDEIRRCGVRGALAGLVVPAGAAIQMFLEPPGLARMPGGWIPNPEADLARALVWGLAAMATALVLGRLTVRTRDRAPQGGVRTPASSA